METVNELSSGAGQRDLLAEETDNLNQFVYASQGQRFLNWLIDNMLMRFGLSYLTGMAIGLLLSVIAPDFLSRIAVSEGRMTFDILLLSVIVGYFNYVVYYTLCEKLFKGYTLGKIITGTKAIRQDGNELTFKDALLRSLSRCVPFEVLSGFSTLTWHDSWTDTMVVKAR
ncbi:MAG: RDD family protein [Chitinophagaceae bacterium]|nr:RDD family protein [Chitinophagaceae bacterium]